MTESRPLYITGNPDMPKIKEAKASMDLGYLVQPVILDRDWQRFPGSARVLAWGMKPYHPCDYALVSDKTASDGLVAALRWVLGTEVDPRATNVAGWFEEYLGKGVWELDGDELAAYNKVNDLQLVSKRLKFEEKGNSGDGYH